MATKRLLLALILVGSIGCSFFGKDDAKPIFVGEPETIIVEPPDDAYSLTYDWRILDLPDESLLVPDFSATSNVFTFSADLEGEYTFSAVVNSGGEEVADHIFRFVAVEDTSIVPMQPVVAAPSTPLPGAAALALQAELAAAEKKAEKPMVTTPKPAPKKKATPKKMTKKRTPRKAKPVPKDVVAGHYTIQVSSWNTAKKAQKVKKSLDDLGHDAYIQRVWIEELGEVWWRVRLGDFTNIDEARKVKDELASQFADIWVDNTRKDMVETE